MIQSRRFTAALSLALALPLALALALTTASSAHAQSPIALHGNGPFYRLELPLALHGLAAFDDLRDLRVRNGAGQAAPFGWLDGEAEAAQAAPASSRAPLFALPSASTSASGGTSTEPADELLLLKMRPDGSIALARVGAAPSAAKAVALPAPVAEWVIDASQVTGALVQIRFELAAGPMGLFPYTLEGSDDLRQWHRLGADDQLVRLRHGEQTIERLAVELDQVRTRFLRLRWQNPALAPQLSAVWLDSVQQLERSVPAIAWGNEVRPAACGVDFCDYPAPHGLPLQSLRIVLGQANTLAPVRLSSVAEPSSSVDQRRARPRNALFVLRHGLHASREPRGRFGEAPAATETLLADTTVFRLNQSAGEARSSAIPMDGGAHTRLRLRTDGPIAALGASPPSLLFGARPRALVFLAQGQPPFVLGWNANAQAALDGPGPLPLTQLMPGYQPGRTPALDGASVTLALSAAVAVPATPAVVETESKVEPAPSSRKLWLWSALGVGLLLLGGMAWSLLSGLKAQAVEPRIEPDTGPAAK